MTWLFRDARPGDWDAVAGLLARSGLPLEGVRDHLAAFVVAVRDGRLAGCAGMERYGAAGLLRSVAVADGERGRGLGSELVRRVLQRALAQGTREIFLLTTTAAGFFRRLGFQAIGRSQVPAALRASAEFQGACPDTAVSMGLCLDHVPALQRALAWVRLDVPGAEHLSFRGDVLGFTAEGTVIAVQGGRPLLARYLVEGAADWTPRRVVVDLADGGRVELRSHGDGIWRTPEGAEIAALRGCLDVDVSLTPFTNTLAIRRLGLGPGESADLRAVYVEIDGSSTPAAGCVVQAVRQRYTRLASGEGRRYRYESLESGFAAELDVDGAGFVVHYPDCWRLVALDARP